VGNNDDLYLFQPEFAEQAVDVVEAVIRTGEVDIIVIDSIAMMSPAVEIEKSAKTR
jgi:recombination protein RecA